MSVSCQIDRLNWASTWRKQGLDGDICENNHSANDYNEFRDGYTAHATCNLNDGVPRDFCASVQTLNQADQVQMDQASRRLMALKLYLPGIPGDPSLSDADWTKIHEKYNEGNFQEPASAPPLPEFLTRAEWAGLLNQQIYTPEEIAAVNEQWEIHANTDQLGWNDLENLLPPIPRPGEARAAAELRRRLSAPSDPFDPEVPPHLAGPWAVLGVSHEGGATSASFSPDGGRIVSGGTDGNVKLWNATTGVLIRVWGELDEAHYDAVNSASFSPDGMHILTAGGGEFKVFDTTTGEVRFTNVGNRASYHPDGTRIVSVSEDGFVSVFTNVGDEVVRFQAHDDGVKDAFFTPDGTSIVSLSAMNGTVKVSNAEDGTVQLEFNVATYSATSISLFGQQLVLANREGSIITVNWLAAMTAPQVAMEIGDAGGDVFCLSHSPTGDRFVSAGRSIIVWDAITGERIHTMEGPRTVNSASFSPDGRFIVSASANRFVTVWDATTGRSVRTLGPHATGVKAASYNQDGSLVASAGDDGTVRVFRTDWRDVVLTLSGHAGPVKSVAWGDGSSPHTIVSGGRDGTVRLWNATTGAPVLTLQADIGGVNSVSLKFGRILAAGEYGIAKLWDATTGFLDRTLAGPKSRILDASFSPNGDRVVSGSSDGYLRLWDARRVPDAQKEPLFTTPLAHVDGVTSVRYSLDGAKVVSAGKMDGSVKVWSTAEPSSLQRLDTIMAHDFAVLLADFSPDGRSIVSSGSIISSERDWEIKIWDAPAPDAPAQPQRVVPSVPTVPSDPTVPRITFALFSPDGRRLLVVPYDTGGVLREYTLNPPFARSIIGGG